MIILKFVKRTKGSTICDALRDLVLFLQLQKSEKYPWWSVTSSLQIYTKVTLLHGCFLDF